MAESPFKAKFGMKATFIQAMTSAGVEIRNLGGFACSLIGVGSSLACLFYDGVSVTGSLMANAVATTPIGVNIPVADGGNMLTNQGQYGGSLGLRKNEGSTFLASNVFSAYGSDAVAARTAAAGIGSATIECHVGSAGNAFSFRTKAVASVTPATYGTYFDVTCATCTFPGAWTFPALIVSPLSVSISGTANANLITAIGGYGGSLSVPNAGGICLVSNGYASAYGSDEFAGRTTGGSTRSTMIYLGVAASQNAFELRQTSGASSATPGTLAAYFASTLGYCTTAGAWTMPVSLAVGSGTTTNFVLTGSLSMATSGTDFTPNATLPHVGSKLAHTAFSTAGNHWSMASFYYDSTGTWKSGLANSAGAGLAMRTGTAGTSDAAVFYSTQKYATDALPVDSTVTPVVIGSATHEGQWRHGVGLSHVTDAFFRDLTATATTAVAQITGFTFGGAGGAYIQIISTRYTVDVGTFCSTYVGHLTKTSAGVWTAASVVSEGNDDITITATDDAGPSTAGYLTINHAGNAGKTSKINVSIRIITASDNGSGGRGTVTLTRL